MRCTSCCSTGMLLEQHKDTVLKLCSEPTLLEEQVNLALKTLNEYVVTMLSLPSQLCYSCSVISAALPFKCRGIITMQSMTVANSFVVFFFPHRQRVDTCDSSSDTEDTERLGEKLFLLVERLDPVHATDITGKTFIFFSFILLYIALIICLFV